VTDGPDRPGVALVLAPMRSELRPLLRALSARPATIGGVDVHRSRAGRHEVVVGLIGVGPGPARTTTERLLDALGQGAGAVAHVVVNGIAGGIGADVAVGDTVVPDTVLDVASGRSYRAAATPGPAPSGTIATVDELILDLDRLGRMADEGIVALDMETAAVAEVCEARRVPWSAVRVISDRPRDGLLDEGVMTMLRPDGSVDPLAALRHLVAHPRRLPKLVRLGRDAAAAASSAARTTVGALSRL